MKIPFAPHRWVAAAALLAAMAAQGADKPKKKEAAPAPPADPIVEKARQDEKAAATEENSREMARSASREIARSERRRAEQSLKAYITAQDELKQAKGGAASAAPATAGLAARAAPAKAAKPAKTVAAAVIDPAVVEARRLEKLAATENNSRDMASAATREIARSERRRAEESLKANIAAREALKQANGGAASATTALPRAVEDKLTSLRVAEGRLVADTITANKASRELFISEMQLRDKMAATRDAELKAAEAKAKAAEQAQAADAAALRRAVLELRALRVMEIQQWAAIRKDTAQELAEQSGEAARIAKEIAAVEPDSAKATDLVAFAKKQEKEKTEADEIACEAVRTEEAMAPEIYELRVAVMGGLRPLAPKEWDYAKARHLLVRAGFGGTPQEVAKLHEMGLHKAVDHLVEFYRQPAAAPPFDPTPLIATDPLEGKMKMRGRGNRAVGFDRTDVNLNQQIQMRRWWLQRMVESPRPLQEKLTLFWHGHFASQDSVVQNSYAMFRQLEFFREHAAGNFGALLYGLVHDPAMIRYLDNNKNAKGKPNENLAREILELFSMGVDQGYTEKDIIEAARALTGYNYDNATGTFRFLYSQHDTTNKTIFGKTGPWTGDDLARLILERPETSSFIAKKLFEFFAYPDPDKATVDGLAAVLMDRQYALEPMLKNLFLSGEFYGSRAMGNQIKSPVELMVGLLRDLGARPQVANWPIESPRSKNDGSSLAITKPVTDYEALDLALQQMGMQLMEPPDVKGWRYGRPWISSQRLFVRYNAVASVIDAVGEQGVDVVGLLLAGGCTNGDEVVDYLARACLSRPLNADKRSELIKRVGKLPPCGEWTGQRSQLNEKLRSVLVLLLCMPEHQMS